MAIIALEGMRFYAHHGISEMERTIGSDYKVDVFIEADVDTAGDDLGGTINYETIFSITKAVMKRPCSLLETLAQSIIDKIIHLFDTIEHIRVRIVKQNPPLGACIDAASVELEEDYNVSCSKCGRGFLSHSFGDWWTKYGKIYPETKATLQRTYGPFICRSCLKPHFIR